MTTTAPQWPVHHYSRPSDITRTLGGFGAGRAVVPMLLVSRSARAGR
jgi:hypothetical protein